MTDSWIVSTGRWLTKRRGILLAPLFATAFMAARWAAHPWMEAGQDLLSLLCLAGGVWLRITAASYHESGHDAQPITAGPYAWVRHPLYLANFLLGLGIVLAAGGWPMVVFYVLFFLPLHMVIARAEEMHLTGLYGQKYELYRRAVPAILPWRRFQGPHYGARSRLKLDDAQEWLKAVGYGMAFAVILVFKAGRQRIPWPVVPPLSPGLKWGAVGLVVFAVAYRPKIRWLRSLQTVIAVVCVLLLVVHRL